MSRQSTQPVQSAPSSPPPGPPPADGAAARSAHLDASLDRAHRLAISQHHGGVSSEHLLFALSEDPEALGVLGASTVSIERLRADIGTHLSQLPADTPAGKPILPNADLVKVLKLSAMAAQQSARRQIDGAIVLAAMIGDASTPSAGLLRAHGLTFNEVIRVLQKSAATGPAASTPAPLPGAPPAPVVASQPTPTARSTPPIDRTDPANTGPSATRVDVAAAAANAPQSAISTDERLASVRARLQQAAPPKPRPVERPEAAAPATPAIPATDARPPVVNTTKPAAAPQAQPTGPRTPDELTTIPAVTTGERTQPVAATSASASPPQSSVAPAAPATQPPLPLVPSAASRATPPPLPLPTVSSPQMAAQNSAQTGPRTPPINRTPPIAPPTIDLRALMGTVATQMRQGETSQIEITVPRRALEIPMAPGHRWPPLRVATMRLRAPVDAAHVELASPETLWISPPRVHQGAADDATWRWRVTPREEGTFKLNLAGATRIVGGEGISGEVPLGEETIEIDVLRRGSRRWLVGLLLFGNLLALGLLAMIMSGRAGELFAAAWTSVRGILGGS